jgi:hypothetical protein
VLAILIWALRFKLEYRLSEQNCQNFAYLLYERIRISKESLREDGFPDEELRTFKRFPRRFTQGVKTLVYDPIKLSLAFDSLGALSVLHPGVAVLGSVITLAVLYKATKDKDRDYVKKRAADMTPEHPDYSEWKEEQSLENLRRVLRRCQGAATFKKKLLDAKQAGKTVRIIDQFQHAKGKMTVDDYNYISEDDLYSDGSDSDFESGFENDPEDFFNTDYGEHHLQRATLHSHEFHPVGQEGDRFRFNNTYGSRPSEQASGNWIDESGELMVVDENNKSEETPQPTAECAGIVDTSGANCPEEWTPWSEWTWDTDQNQWRTICWSLTVQGMYRDEWFDPASSSLDGTSSDERGKSAQHEGRRKGGRTSRGKRDRHRH